MKEHKIKSVMLTTVCMQRQRLITKEETESYCNGEKRQKDSVNDDLESFFENIRLGKELNNRGMSTDVPSWEYVQTYFLPKLTPEELEWVERRDTNYLKTFSSWYPDVDKTEMMLSESDSKYVKGESQRRTFVIENLSETSSEPLFETPSENSHEASSETSSETSSESSSKNLNENSYENSSERQSCFKNCCNCSLQ